MKWLSAAAALVLTLHPLPASPQDQPFPRNAQIEVEYVPPKDARFQLLHDRMKQLRTLELLQEFLAPLKLPRKLAVKMDQCGGALTVPYKPQSGLVTICYEYLAAIHANAPIEGVVLFGPGRRLTSQQTIAGAVVHLMLHQTAYAVFDILEIPVWGRVDDAVDNVSGFIMLEFGEEVAWTTLLGSAWFMAQRGMMGTGFFTDTARPSEAQRFYNFLCLAYGRHATTYAFLVNSFNLPEARARFCKQDYVKLRGAFRDTFVKQHVDPAVLALVQKRKWLPQ
jgi:hypothetical protein